MNIRSIKKYLYELLESRNEEDPFNRWFNFTFLFLIFFNTLTIALDTIKTLDESSRYVLFVSDLIVTYIFLVEYIARLWTSTCNPNYRHPLWGRLRYALTPFMLIDFFAIIPSLLPLFIQFDLKFMRIIRFLRIFRLLKLTRYSGSVELMLRVVKGKKEELFITVFLSLLLLIISSFFMYLLEHDAQPEAFPNVLATMWWGVVTLTTVGYGDTYPITGLGRLLGAIIAFLGIGLFALPAGIIGSGFVEEVNKKKQKNMVCPHCGKPID